MEATGTYWLKLAYALFQVGFAVSVVNPREPKYFSKMRQQHSKTDAIDAVMLMEFAQIFKPQLWTPPPEISETLRQYLTYRNQLIDFLGQARSQLHAMQQNPLADSDLIQRMELRISQLKTEIELFKNASMIYSYLIHNGDKPLSIF